MHKHFTVNEYEYWTDEDVEPDVRKLWHYCRKNGREIKMSNEFYNHTPYHKMTRQEFTSHVMTLQVFMQG